MIDREPPRTARTYHLRLEYRPSMLPVGACVTVLTLLASAGALLVGRSRAQRRRSPEAA